MGRIILICVLTTLVSAQSLYKEIYQKPFFKGSYPQKTPFLIRPYPVVLDTTGFRVYFPTSIAHSFMNFTYMDGSYDAEVELEVAVRNKETGAAQSQIWRSSIHAASFKETVDRNHMHLTLDSLDMPAGHYDILCKYRDMNSGQQLEFKRQFTIMPLEDTFFATPLFFHPDAEAANQTGPTSPAVSPLQQFWDYNSPLGVELSFWSKQDDQPIRTRVWLIETVEGDTIFSLDTTLHANVNTNTLQFIVERKLLEERGHRLKVVHNHGSDSTQMTIPLEIVWFDKPISLWDPDLALKPIQYIVEESIYKDLSKSSEKNRHAAISEFWSSLDDTPETPFNELQNEFYARVDSTISRFSTRNRLGWETDPGRIFIMYGPPHKVEDHSLDPIARPFMRWIYVMNDTQQIFTFEALDGRKEFRLTDSRVVDM